MIKIICERLLDCWRYFSLERQYITAFFTALHAPRAKIRFYQLLHIHKYFFVGNNDVTYNWSFLLNLVIHTTSIEPVEVSVMTISSLDTTTVYGLLQPPLQGRATLGRELLTVLPEVRHEPRRYYYLPIDVLHLDDIISAALLP